MHSSLRVYELARLLDLESREVLDELGILGIDVTTPSNSIKGNQLQRVVTHFSDLENGLYQSRLSHLLPISEALGSNKSTQPVRARFMLDPFNFREALDTAKDGEVLHLEAGDYKGPFDVKRSVTLRGQGYDTVLFASSEPAARVTARGVRLENLRLERTNGGAEGATVLECTPTASSTLSGVFLIGAAPGALFDDACWDLPQVIEFGEIEAGQLLSKEITICSGSECRIRSTVTSIKVGPTFAAPGRTVLRIELNGTEAIAGSRLFGEILLSAAGAPARAIPVSAHFVAPKRPTLLTRQMEREYGQIDFVTWGLTFPNGVAQRFMRNLRGGEDQFDLREDAVRFLRSLTEDASCLYYLRKRGTGKRSDQQRWELTVATDHPHHPLPQELASRNCTLKLSGVVDDDGYDSGFLVLDATLIDTRRGGCDAFAFPLCIRFEPLYQNRTTLPDEIVDAIDEVPDCRDYLPTSDQLTIWDSYVAIEDRLAKARQFCVPYVHIRHSVDRHSTILSFKVDDENASVSSVETDSISTDEFWGRAQKAKNDLIKLLDDDAFEDTREVAQLLGRIEQVDRDGGFLRVRLEEDVSDAVDSGRLQIPRSGWLLFDAFGNVMEVKRKTLALRDLRAGKSSNPFLGSFFFDSSQARIPQEIPRIERWLDSARVNEEQRLAVEKVMAAEDLALIWGPPGTGKTTVIAEICYQVALQGGRTLIASQTNLAVDNAMSRLVHDPNIRALRKGKESKVEDEGKQYTEKQVIGTWLNKTAVHCEKTLARRREKVEIFRRLLADQNRLEEYIRLEEEHTSSQRALLQRLAQLKAKRDTLLAESEEDGARLASATDLLAGLSELERDGTRRSVAAIGVQEAVFLLIADQPQVMLWRRRLDDAAAFLATEGVVSPDLPALAKVEALQEVARRRRDLGSERLHMARLALQNVAALQKQLDRLASCEKVRQEAARALDVALKDERDGAARQEAINGVLQEAQAADHLLSAVIEGDGALMQEELHLHVERSDLYAEFCSRVDTAVKLVLRLGGQVPDLPPLARAAECRRTISSILARSGDPAFHAQQLLQSAEAAQQSLRESEELLVEKVDGGVLLRGVLQEVELLAGKAAKVERSLNLVRESQQEFGGWIEALRAHLELQLSLGITAESRFGVESLPPLPQALNDMVAHLGAEAVNWLPWREQFVAFLNSVAEKARQRDSAVKVAHRIHLRLDQTQAIIGPRYAMSVGAGVSARTALYDLARVEEESRALLSRTERPLGIVDRVADFFGRSRERTDQARKLAAVQCQLEAALAALPSPPAPEELRRSAEGFITTLARQGETWFGNGLRNLERKLGEHFGAKNAAEEQKRHHEERLRQIEQEITERDSRIRALVSRLATPQDGLQRIGVRVEPLDVEECSGRAAIRAYLCDAVESIRQWLNDLATARDVFAAIDPVDLLAAMSRIEKERMKRLSEQLAAADAELKPLRDERAVAEVRLQQADREVQEERSAWEVNPLCSMAWMPPFDALSCEDPLAIILSRQVYDSASAARMQTELDALVLDSERETAMMKEGLKRLNALDTQAILKTAGEVIGARQTDLKRSISGREAEVSRRLSPEIAAIEEKLALQDRKLSDDRSWWVSTWESMPGRLRGQMDPQNIHDPCFLRSIAQSLPAWRSELGVEENYLKRYQSLVGDWISRVSQPSEQDATDLRNIYLANANVIGITCSQAAAPKFSGEFPEFDVVIVDEVSKCTPPELMMPALKGKKVVLVGDHRQLPPMIDDKTIEDVAVEAGIAVDELHFLKTSTFNTLYNNAHDQIKQGLCWQYRMHPSIMGAINQFYDRCLKNGVTDAATTRAHGVGGKVLKKDHHLVWVTTPLNTDHREAREGTSFYNLKEIEAIEGICRQLDDAWAPRVAAGEPRKEIAVITFYLPQLRKIREKINGGTFRNLNIRTGTVDRFQGMERPVVIVSLVRNNPAGSVGFAKHPERVNVAFSRAQELLLIVGCRELFVQHAPAAARRIYQEVSDEVRRHGGLLDVSHFC